MKNKVYSTGKSAFPQINYSQAREGRILIRVTSFLTVFLKHGQMDFSKASNSISHHLTSIFPENCQIFSFCWVGLVGLVGRVRRVGQSSVLGGTGGWVGCVGYLHGSRGLSTQRARSTKSGPEGPPTRSRGPPGP